VTLAVVTPSYPPDLESFRRLHESVVRWTDPSVRHLVCVAAADAPLYRAIRSDRLDVVTHREALGSEFIATTRLGRLPGIPRGYRIAAINPRRPWPPVRGWILQQLAKLGVVAALDVDVALVIDSEALLVRPVEEAVFRRGDAVRLYRMPHGVTDDMARHRAWQRTSGRLLGLAEPEPDSPDYIGPFPTWSPRVVRDCLARVEEVTGMPWARAAGAELQFSELMLVGAYASRLAPRLTFAADRMLCRIHWGPEPLDRAGAAAFLQSIAPDDLAVLIQSNSGTPDDVVRWVARRLRDGA
jgi:hypothetical protein